MRLLISCAVAAILAASPALTADRTLTDDTGREVTVPVHPERVIVMHEPLLGIPLMDLGLDLSGSYGRTDDGGFVIATDFIDTVLGGKSVKPRGIGPVGQPDLERMRALEPDLIVATELDAAKAEQFATVAPVYLQKVGGAEKHGVDIQEDLAAVVGLEDVFAARKAAYLDRVAALRASLPVDPAGQTYLPVFLTDQLNIVGPTSGMVQALEDLGYTRLEVEEIGASQGGAGSIINLPLSAEVFGQLNPDLLILLNSYMDDGRDEAGTRDKLGKIVPGWDHFMKPAIEGRILFVDPAKVITPSIASAELMLDAIEAWSTRER
ncbi:ABC transporter substrate-binding protein [Rhodobacteraceae bacterium NNCM2]|nr:ABC transporter substrate-binding protein [Coraliihabitans acroporae]